MGDREAMHALSMHRLRTGTAPAPCTAERRTLEIAAWWMTPPIHATPGGPSCRHTAWECRHHRSTALRPATQEMHGRRATFPGAA